MAPISSIVLGLQGLFTVLNGLSPLIFPTLAAQSTQSLKIGSMPAMHAISLGALSLGYSSLTM